MFCVLCTPADLTSDHASVGTDILDNVTKILASFSLVPFLRVSGMDPGQYRTLIQGAISELRNSRLRVYFMAYVHKPLLVEYRRLLTQC